MMNPEVEIAGKAEEERLIDILMLAFSTDPAARWSWPDPQQYLEHFPSFVRGLGGSAFQHGTAHYSEGFGGAALWLPPGVHPDEESLTALFQQSVPDKKLGEVFAVLEQMSQFHPGDPHWYLPLIGVDPFHQGKGLGGALLQYALSACDRDGQLAYLESSNPRNIPLYERAGFRVLGTIQVGSSPPIVPMLREPANGAGGARQRGSTQI